MFFDFSSKKHYLVLLFVVLFLLFFVCVSLENVILVFFIGAVSG